MKMNMKAAKNMRGFMCQSPAATAVCMASEPLSVIVQRRPDRTLTDHARLLNNTQCTRLIESRSRALASATRRSSTVRSLALKSDQEKASECALTSAARRSSTVRSLALKIDQEKASESQLASSLATNDRSLTLKSDHKKASKSQVASSLATKERSLTLKSDQEKTSESQVASSLATKDQVFQVKKNSTIRYYMMLSCYLLAYLYWHLI